MLIRLVTEHTAMPGNPVTRNTKSEKLRVKLAKARLPEYKDNGNTSNIVNINFGDVNSTYYIGIDLKTWHMDEVAKLKALVQEVENRKQLEERVTVVDASQ